MYGSLEVICGPMFASKTTSLVREILWIQNGLKKSSMVMKPAFDTRYDATRIVTHDGLSCEAHPINRLPTFDTQYEYVFFDEVQFFTDPYFDGDIVEIIRGLLRDGTNVVAAGLDIDWQGKPFPITASLMAMADKLTKRHAHCTVCGRPAGKTLKLTQEGDSVELGTHSLYEARCNEHWI